MNREEVLGDLTRKIDRAVINPDAFPPEMLARDQWVTWEWQKEAYREGNIVPLKKWNKVPSGGKYERMSFSEALKRFTNDQNLAGIGFTLGDGIMGFDLDNHRDRKTGKLTSFAELVIKKCRSYCEVSPTGTGVKIYMLGEIPEKKYRKKCDTVRLEAYNTQFFVTTSRILPEYKFPMSRLSDGGIWVLDEFLLDNPLKYDNDTNVDVDEVRRAIAFIPTKFCDDRSSWIKVAMCAKAVSNTPEMRDAWVEWSKNSKKYKDTDDGLWEGFNPSRAGAHGIFKMAKEGGFEPKGRPEISVNDVKNIPKTVEKICTNLSLLGTPDSPTWVEDEDDQRYQIFRRGREVVQTLGTEILRVDRGRMLVRIPIVVDIIKPLKNDQKAYMTPPPWLVETVLSNCVLCPTIRPLNGVITAPTIRPDGGIVQTPGYDLETGLYYTPDRNYEPIPEEISERMLKADLSLLLDTLHDFPFAARHDKAGALAMILSFAARPCISGCVPLFAISGNSAGCGKGRLTDLAYAITHGTPAPKMSKSRDSELQKEIPSLARTGTPIVCLDNILYSLGGEVLEAALTSTTVNSRVLGQTDMTGELPMTMIWVATGNNITYANDFARRVIQIKLETPLDRPAERSDFKHRDLMGYVIENRPRLLTACLTILRAFMIAGKPAPDDKLMGSFEDWTRVIRNCVVWTGVGDPLESREAVDQLVNDDELVYEQLLLGIQKLDPESKGVTSRDIWHYFKSGFNADQENPELVAAVEGLVERFPSPDAHKLGIAIQRHVGRNFKGMTLRRYLGHGKVIRWVVKSLGGCSDLF